MNDAQLQEEYRRRHAAVLAPLAASLEAFVKDIVAKVPRVDRVSARAKAPDRFVAKARKKQDDGTDKYSEPLLQIQDLVGVRIVVYYSRDVEPMRVKVESHFRAIELKAHCRESEWEFGYEGRHMILATPSDVTGGFAAGDVPEFFELQIKTLFQHAWSEAEHDLGYKTQKKLEKADRRCLAFAAAQAWGADREFDELVERLTESRA